MDPVLAVSISPMSPVTHVVPHVIVGLGLERLDPISAQEKFLLG